MKKDSWDQQKEKYDENMIEDKKLPVFFDYFDYSKHFKNVYEPSDDTFLLIDCLKLEKSNLEEMNLKYTLELGVGSGFVSCCFLNLLKEISEEKYMNNKHYCVDVNQDALALTNNLINYYGFEANTIESNLFSKFNENKEGIKFDVIIFNPVYSIFTYYLAICDY